LDFGFWILDFRFVPQMNLGADRILDFRFWILDCEEISRKPTLDTN
jgi:hypothetical protein